jgi:hypothetical protein
LKKNLILNPTWMDDRYCIAFALDYLKTGLELNNNITTTGIGNKQEFLEDNKNLV